MVDNGFTFSNLIFKKGNDASLHKAINQRLTGYLAANDTGYTQAQLIMGYRVHGTKYGIGGNGNRNKSTEDFAHVWDGGVWGGGWDDDDANTVNAPIVIVRPL